MNKIVSPFRTVMMALGALAIHTGCGRREKAREIIVPERQVVNENLNFESYTFDLIGEYTTADTFENPAGRYIRYTGEGILPKSLGEGGIRNLRDSLMRMARVSFDGDRNPVPMIGQDSVRLSNLQPSEVSPLSFIESEMSASLVSPRVVTFECARSGYFYGAAHGNKSVGYVNYYLPEGKILSLDDLMNPGYRNKLLRLIRAALQESEVDLLVNPSGVNVASQFVITTEGLTFSYDPYEIAPYSEGVVTVDIPLESLLEEGLLSRDGRIILTGEP